MNPLIKTIVIPVARKVLYRTISEAVLQTHRLSKKLIERIKDKRKPTDCKPISKEPEHERPKYSRTFRSVRESSEDPDEEDAK